MKLKIAWATAKKMVSTGFLALFIKKMACVASSFALSIRNNDNPECNYMPLS